MLQQMKSQELLYTHHLLGIKAQKMNHEEIAAKKTLSIEGVIETMVALLSYDMWNRSATITKLELDNVGPAASHLMQDITINFPKDVQEGSHGYHKVKFHGL